MASPKFNPAELRQIVQAMEELRTATLSLTSNQDQISGFISSLLQLRSAFSESIDTLSKTQKISGLNKILKELSDSYDEIRRRISATTVSSSNADEYARWVKEAGRLADEIGKVDEEIKKVQSSSSGINIFDAFKGLKKGFDNPLKALGNIFGQNAGGEKGEKSKAAVAAAGGPEVLAVAAIAGVFVEAGNQVIDGFKKLYSSILDIVSVSSKFVAVAAPGLVDRLNLAFQDLNASIGTNLVPVIQEFIRVVDYVNSVITSFQGKIEPLVQFNWDTVTQALGVFIDVGAAILSALLPALNEFGKAVRTLWEFFQPLIASFAEADDGLKLIVGTIGGVLIIALVEIAAVIWIVVASLRLFIGAIDVLVKLIKGAFGKASWSDVGKAIAGAFGIGDRKKDTLTPKGDITVFRKPEIIDTEEIGKQARLSAYGSRSVPEQQLQQLQAINRNTQQISGNTTPQAQQGQQQDLPGQN